MDLPPEIARRFDVAALETDAASLAVIGPNATIVWVNAAWDAFASLNGAPDACGRYRVGTSYFDGISGVLRSWFEARIALCLESGQPFEIEYECSSAEVLRALHLRALPVAGHVLMSHSLRRQAPHTRQAMPALEAIYRAPNGLVVQCSNCRRYRRADDTAWDWLPAWVLHQPEPVSHSICTLCIGFYYGELFAEPPR